MKITKRSIVSAAMGLLFAAGTLLAQNQTCPRANCPNPGRNCPRQGQCMRPGTNARRGPGTMNRGMRRGGMQNCPGCPSATPAVKPEAKK